MTEKIRHETKSWLSNPGNLISLVLAVISISSAVYNAVASRDSQLAESFILTKSNAEQIRSLNEKFDRTVELFNRHVQWSEGRSANLEELQRRIDRLERLAEMRTQDGKK